MTSRSINLNLFKEVQQHTIDDLLDVKSVFDKHRIVFWLDYGTLLGAVRDGRIIPWDDDVDLGVLEAEKKKLLRAINELVKKRFYVHYDGALDKLVIMRLGRGIHINLIRWIVGGKYACIKLGTAKFHAIIVILSFVRRIMCIPQGDYLNYRLKLCELWPLPNRFIWLLLCRFLKLISIVPFKVRVAVSRVIKLLERTMIKLIGDAFIVFIFPSYHLREFNVIEFYGTRFRVPSDTEKYLERHYGKGWRTPMESWHWLKDACTRRIVTIRKRVKKK